MGNEKYLFRNNFLLDFYISDIPEKKKLYI